MRFRRKSMSEIESVIALERAKDHLVVVEGRYPEVNLISDKLRNIREQNGFTEGLRQILEGNT